MNRTDRLPILALDVDGVINVSPGFWSVDDLDTHVYTGDPGGPVYIPSVVPDALAALHVSITDAGGAVVWNTSWPADALLWLAPLVGLPTGLTHFYHPRGGGVGWGWSSKLTPIYGAYDPNMYRVAVLDDVIGGKDSILFDDNGWLLPDLNGAGTAYGRGLTGALLDDVSS